MKVIVQKYGGSSLASPELIKRVARRVVATKKRGYGVVVVVSALGDTTDHLVELAHQISSNPSPREMDMLLSVGERVSIALMSMAIIELGYQAISFTGSQVGIITNTDHTRARILEVKGDRLRKELARGKIVVIAGYQGVSTEKEITTLGRGGSDTTAIALAAALGAEKCEIMTDVDGVYSAKPQWVPDAIRHTEVNYDEMLDMAESGAQVLKSSAVEFAKRHNIKIAVGSSFSGHIGTIICAAPLDHNRVTGVSHNEKVTLIQVQNDEQTLVASLLETMAVNGIPVKLIWQLRNDFSFLIGLEDLAETRKYIEKHKLISICDDTIGLLTVTGIGINFGTDVMARVQLAFKNLNIQPRIWHFSETRLCFGVVKTSLKQAVNEIHGELLGRGKTDSKNIT